VLRLSIEYEKVMMAVVASIGSNDGGD
jgi:hypothetical protein